jgi:8-amino-7-oxononanoate synthase
MTWLDEQLGNELKQRAAQHLRRSLRCLPSDVLDLASNDYLGLARHPLVITGACRAAQEWGGGARASRLMGGHTGIHARLEATLAQWKQTEAALVFPSGYHANLGVITSLAGSGDTLFCDKRNHASLIDACRLAESAGSKVRYYNTPQKLQTLLGKAASGRRTIVSDTVYSMDGDLADVPILVELAQCYKAILILDDAHGTGTLGEAGCGAWKYFYPHENVTDVPVVQIGTLSKALGSQGGFVAGSKVLCDWLLNNARPFIYTTGLNPAACGAALSAIEVLQAEPERLARLREVATQLSDGLQQLGYKAPLQPSAILAVILGDAERTVRASEVLLEHGVWCPAVRPPTVPANQSRLRITASASLNNTDVERALAVFSSVRSQIFSL